MQIQNAFSPSRGIMWAVLLVAMIISASAQTADLPAGWTPVGDGPDHYLTETHPNAGRDDSGLRIRSIEPGEHGFGGIGQTITAEDYLGERVRLTGHIRSFNVIDHAGLWMRVDPTARGRRPVAFDNMRDRAITGNTEWQSYEIVLDVPEEAGHILFGAILSGEGEVHVDDLSLEVVDESVPVTDMMADGDFPSDE